MTAGSHEPQNDPYAYVPPSGDQYGSPQYGAPQDIPPQYVAPEFSASQYGAPQYGAPQYGVAPYAPSPYTAGPYGTGPYGSPTRPPGTNGFAIAALVLSLIGPITCGLGFVLGVIFGCIALSQIRQRPQDGRGMAIAGLWISGVLTVLSIGFVAFIMATADEYDGYNDPYPSSSYTDDYDDPYNSPPVDVPTTAPEGSV